MIDIALLLAVTDHVITLGISSSSSSFYFIIEMEAHI